MTPQLTLEVASLKQVLGAPMTPLKKPLPWAYRLQQALFGQWQDIEDGRVRCPHCGSTLVAGYPYNGKAEARAFLQALQAKGYQPEVIITDMNQDYTEPIRAVFPHAEHHECVFHALQWAQRLIKEVYGNDYAETHPEAEGLKKRIYKMFDAKTKRTVDKRYREVMALQDRYVAQMPEAACIFDFLERHYPKLVNAVENPLTPLTNPCWPQGSAIQWNWSFGALTNTTRICVVSTALRQHGHTFTYLS